jgi:hypothetical protein
MQPAQAPPPHGPTGASEPSWLLSPCSFYLIYRFPLPPSKIHRVFIQALKIMKQVS